MATDDVKKQTDLDDVLVKFGAFGPYHLKLMALMVIAYLSNAIYCANYVFTVENVQYRCADPLPGDACYANSTAAACTEWIYENPDSFVGEFQLACSDWKRTLVGSVHSLGYMIGLLLVGPLSDRFGRKALFIVLGVAGGVFGLARSFVYSYWLYIVLEALEAALGDCFSPIYMLGVEITPTKHRVKFLTAVNTSFGLGGMTLALAAYLFPYYRTLLRVIYAPAIVFLLYIFCIDESPRWLLSKGRKENAVAVIENIAKTNKVKIDQRILDDLQTKIEENDKISFKELMKITFSSKTLVKRCVICIIWWTACSFVAYGITINTVELEGNKYLNYALVSLVEIPANVIVYFILDRCRRKPSLIASFLIGAVLCLALPFVPTEYRWVSLVFFLGGKVMSSIYFNITYLYTSELFPTYTRNSMHALCSSLGRIGSMVAPQTPLLMVYWQGFPFFLFGVTSLIAGIVTFFVPDTADNPLPNNVHQAESINCKSKVNNDHCIQKIYSQ